jgi:hypothetical protein
MGLLGTRMDGWRVARREGWREIDRKGGGWRLASSEAEAC